MTFLQRWTNVELGTWELASRFLTGTLSPFKKCFVFAGVHAALKKIEWREDHDSVADSHPLLA